MKIHRLVAAAAACGALLVAGCADRSATTEVTVADSTAATGSTVAVQHVFEAEHFATGALVGDVTIEDCTLSGGTETTCARVTITGYPASYGVGPFCPSSITTPASEAGIWFDGSGVYDLDGAFVEHLASFYDDSEWMLYADDGSINVTDTQAAFEGAARPDVQAEYQNHCVEGRLAWLPDGEPIRTTMLIPVLPVRAAQPSDAHPGNFGITLDGVVIAESAPVDAILGAHTIAAFDDCGGHYNPAAGYHMHGVTGCGHLVDDAAEGDTAMFGYAADGYPVHLPLDDSALPAAALDACNGHSTAEAGYHYHAQSPAKNAILPCLTGEYVMEAHAGGPPPGPPPGSPPADDASATGTLTTIATMLGLSVTDLTVAFTARSNGGPAW